jgi:hypothetical protein
MNKKFEKTWEQLNELREDFNKHSLYFSKKLKEKESWPTHSMKAVRGGGLGRFGTGRRERIGG